MAAVFSWNIRDAGHSCVLDFKNALVFGEDFVFGSNSSRKFSMLLGEFLLVGRNVENAADAEVGVFAAEIKTVFGHKCQGRWLIFAETEIGLPCFEVFVVLDGPDCQTAVVAGTFQSRKNQLFGESSLLKFHVRRQSVDVAYFSPRTLKFQQMQHRGERIPFIQSLSR